MSTPSIQICCKINMPERDYIHDYPGHMGMKVAEVLNFLAFQHNDFKTRVENLKKQIESTVNMEEAKAVVAETLAETAETPKA